MTTEPETPISPLTRRFWAVVIVLLGVYFAVGQSYTVQVHADLWLYRIGLSAAAILATLFISIWTTLALFRRAPRWWKTDLGASLVVFIASTIPGSGALAWVFDFQGGVLHEGWVAWIALNGPIVKTFALSWIAWLWLRQIRLLRAERKADGNSTTRDVG